MINEFAPFIWNKEHRIDIITVEHTLSKAKMLQTFLIRSGFTSKLYTKTPLILSERLYIIFAPQSFKKLPRHYCVYQVEQMTYDYCKTPEYEAILNNAVAIFDYSIKNLEYLKKQKGIKQKSYFLPFDIDHEKLEASVFVQEKKYDVLFYGATSSSRRKAFFETIKSDYKLKVINDLFGEKLERELNKATLIVNIHYKDNAILETCRLSEVLSLGNSILISERSIDHDLDSMFMDGVEFVPAGNQRAMVEKIAQLLNEKEKLAEIIKKNRDTLLSRKNYFYEYAKTYFL